MQPTVYGYLSLDHDDEAEVTALHERLTAHARAEGLALAEVYVDRNIAPGRIVRPGLTVLLDAVMRTEGCAVLVVSPQHLSPMEPVRRAIEVEIQLLGASVILVEPNEQHFPLAFVPDTPAVHANTRGGDGRA